MLREFSTKPLYVFRAGGEDRSDGKVDNLVDFKPDAPVGLFTFAHLQRSLSQILDKPVDLVMLSISKARVLEKAVRAA